MVLRFFGRARPPERPPATLPAGVRVYAVGDVHGRLDLLTILLDRIRADDLNRGPAETRLVMLGDVIDRGPDSAGVVERLRSGVPGLPAVEALMGNHEEVLVRLLDAPELGLLVQFLRIGGYQTLESYGVPERMLELPELYSPAELLEAVPETHCAWFRAMGDSVQVGDYLFVHAGIRPAVPLEEQQPADLRWIRAPFLKSDADHGVTVVHGHTITDAPELRPNRIGIDTGAYSTGVLTALGLEGTERWFLSTADASPRG